MRKVAVLGSTGSIGTQTLAAVERNVSDFQIVSLAAGSNAPLLVEQAQKFRPSLAVLSYPPKDFVPPPIPGVRWLLGETADAALEGADTALVALVGFAGLRCSLAAIRRGMRVCLANKETLVTGGELVMSEISRCGAELLPVDSEHAAIHQCLAARGENMPARLILTASGGPFRTWTKEQMRTATPEQALRHPSWSMGRRITVDSATMMNKGLEIIEAHWLFSQTPCPIDVLIHPQSIIHSMVEYADGAVMAQMGAPDMRGPILYALGYPQRLEGGVPPLDLAKTGQLDFEAPDEQRFPALRLAREVIAAGGIAGAVYNAADEVAVERFLAGVCGFLDIAHAVEHALQSVPQKAQPTLEDIVSADQAARAIAAAYLERK